MAGLKIAVPCSAVECLCEKGRNWNCEGTLWEILICNSCGSQGTHVRCSHLNLNFKQWQCMLCLQKLYLVHQDKWKHELAKHESMHLAGTSAKPEEAGIIDYSSHLRTHPLVPPLEDPFKCDKLKLDMVKESIDQDKPFTIKTECDADILLSACNSLSQLKPHQRAFSDERQYEFPYDTAPYPPPEKQQKTPRKQQQHQTPSGEKPYKCHYDSCCASFVHLRSLKRHQLTHAGEKPYKCHYESCTAAYVHFRSLKIHQLTHTGEKPYKCNYDSCSAAYVHLRSLKRHQLTHTGVKPYKCHFEGCKAAFVDLSYFKAHELRHTCEKPYKCQYESCSAAFVHLRSLKRHQLTHTGEKPYKCHYFRCTAAYVDLHGLKRHQLTHTGGGKPYKCQFDYCTASYADLRGLQSHQLTHTYGWETIPMSL